MNEREARAGDLWRDKNNGIMFTVDHLTGGGCEIYGLCHFVDGDKMARVLRVPFYKNFELVEEGTGEDVDADDY